MKRLNLTTLMIFMLLGLLTSGVVSAHGGYNRFNFGINLGPGYYGYPSYDYYDPFFYPPIYSYPPAVVMPTPPIVLPQAPPVYLQQETTTAIQPQTNYWHYCSNPNGYYPYVKQCPGGWLQVNPQPAQ